VTVGLERLQQLLEAVTLGGVAVKTNVYRVTDASDVYRTLGLIDQRNRDRKTFIIDLTTRDSELLLRKIVRYIIVINMFTRLQQPLSVYVSIFSAAAVAFLVERLLIASSLICFVYSK